MDTNNITFRIDRIYTACIIMILGLFCRNVLWGQDNSIINENIKERCNFIADKNNLKYHVKFTSKQKGEKKATELRFKINASNTNKKKNCTFKVSQVNLRSKILVSDSKLKHIKSYLNKHKDKESERIKELRDKLKKIKKMNGEWKDIEISEFRLNFTGDGINISNNKNSDKKILIKHKQILNKLLSPIFIIFENQKLESGDKGENITYFQLISSNKKIHSTTTLGERMKDTQEVILKKKPMENQKFRSKNPPNGYSYWKGSLHVYSNGKWIKSGSINEYFVFDKGDNSNVQIKKEFEIKSKIIKNSEKNK